MKRYDKFVLKAENGIVIDVSEETNEKLIITAMSIDKANVYSKNYANPLIPKGYKHIDGEWNNGFVIEKCSNGSQFVWIPVESLDSNGTLDGESFTEKFGRRNYNNDEFSEKQFHENFVSELAKQFESVKKYGGFYFSRYNISKNKKTGKPQSVKSIKPWVNINFNEAKEVAAKFEESDNNIYDFAGNVEEWTQEKNGSSSYSVRGGHYCNSGHTNAVANRNYFFPEKSFPCTGFRIALYLK